MSEFEGFDARGEPREGGIEYVDETGAPEETALPPPPPSLPALQTAADLLPPEDDPLASLPQEPPDQDTPPEEATPAFLIVPHRDRTMPSIYMPNGIAVGVWLDEEHHELDGGEVAEMLVLMGMDGKYAAWYGIQRDGRIEADKALAQMPVVQAFAAEEDRRKVEKKRIQDAFVDAQKKRSGA